MCVGRVGDVDAVAAASRQRQQVEPRHRIAVVEGRTITALPLDLHIPPDALEVFLEAFEGPLDLLLYLIRRQNLDILDIRVAAITEQYMRYVDAMKALQLELAAEYLVMAAMLAELKSRMLLPRPPSVDEGEGDDPRAELVRRLMEYERFKAAAAKIDALPRMDRDTFAVTASPPLLHVTRVPPAVDLRDVLLALGDVIRRVELFTRHAVVLEPLSVRERMTRVLQQVGAAGRTYIPFADLFDVADHGGSISAGLERVGANSALIIGVETDFLFPLHQQQDLADGLSQAGVDVDYRPLKSIQGHDSFMVDMDRFRPAIGAFFS